MVQGSIEYLRGKCDSIIEQFQHHCMSDAKWVRLFHLFEAHDELMIRCEVKLVWDNNIRVIDLENITYNFDYYDHAMEAMISGSPVGWYQYKEIEWIAFAGRSDDDLDQIETLISSIGAFELERHGNILRLYGYRK